MRSLRVWDQLVVVPLNERTSLTFKHFLKNILFFCFWRRRIELKCPERGNAKSLFFWFEWSGREWWSWVQPGSALNEKLDFFFFLKNRNSSRARSSLIVEWKILDERAIQMSRRNATKTQSKTMWKKLLLESIFWI